MLETLEPKSAKQRTMRPCSHCGLPTHTVDPREHVFCCHGCMGAYALIHELGLEDFYAMRSNTQLAPGRGGGNAQESVLDDLSAAGVEVHPMSDGLCSVRLSIDGLHCAACSWLIERMQPTIPGLQSARVRMSDQTVELIYDPSLTHPSYVSRKLAKLGYVLSPSIADHNDDQWYLQQQREHWVGIALAAFFAANAMWIGVALYAGESTGMSGSHATFLRWVGTILAALAVALPGRIFIETAWQAIRTRTPHIDVPVAVSLLIGIGGSVAGAAIGVGHVYFDSLASLILLLRIGRYIQFRAQHRTSLWVSQLLRLNSVVATRIEADGTHKIVPSHRLQIGDHVLVQPGGTIPADGTVLAESTTLTPAGSTAISSIDMSLLNGESDPVSVKAGDAVVGGTTNLSARLLFSVTAVGEASRVGRLMEVVRNATTHRTPWIMAADRVSKWFILVVLLLAAGTWGVWATIAGHAIATRHTVALLTISCPCALALAAPLVLTVALGRAARKQIWIRDGNCLERLATPGIIWLDKTGTLTYGRMVVSDWHGEDAWLAYAAALEKSLSTPIATAIHDFAIAELNDSGDMELTEATGIVYFNGKGVVGLVDSSQVFLGNEALLTANSIVLSPEWLRLQSEYLEDGRTVVWLAVQKSVVGMFGIGDSLRSDAIETLRAISDRGWRLGILSGDRQEIVDRLELELQNAGIELVAALGNQSPERKLEVIRSSRQSYRGTCVMVGDGVNDAAAMASADVGIAIRGGSDHALRAAPIFLANQQLSCVVELIDASKNVVRGIRRCFAASLIYNSIAISLAITGWIHPLVAAILMPLSGLSVLAMATATRSFGKQKQLGI